LWIPHQVALEYYQNRINVINSLEHSYADIKNHLKVNYDKIKKDLDSYTRHPILNITDLIDKLNEHRKIIERELDALKKNHPNWTDDDEIQATLEELFDGKIGSHYSKDKLEEIYTLGELRYKLKIPPGYRDAETKHDFTKYGDLILWYQIIEKSKRENLPVILITDDVKDDWWLKIHGDRSPRPELIQEFVSETENRFYMYPANRFMYWAKEYLKIDVDQKSIDEVEKVRSMDQQSLEYFMKYMSDIKYRTTPLEAVDFASTLEAMDWASISKPIPYSSEALATAIEGIKNYLQTLDLPKSESCEADKNEHED